MSTATTPTKTTTTTTTTTTDAWKSQADLMWAWTGDFAAAAVAEEPLSSGMQVLDVAAGTGSSAIPLAQRVQRENLSDVRIVATDLSPGLLEQLRKNAEQAGVSELITTQVDDALAMTAVPSNSQDLVVCVFGLMLMPDRLKAAQEIARVLKPGGRLLCVTWKKIATMELLKPMARELGLDESSPALDPNQNAAYSLSRQEQYAELLPAAGLTLVSVQSYSLQRERALLEKSAEAFVTNPAMSQPFKQAPPEAVLAAAHKLIATLDAAVLQDTVAVFARAMKPLPSA
jgi:ubiquinone/menaquinone biosynthesis C-methylase UbiE